MLPDLLVHALGLRVIDSCANQSCSVMSFHPLPFFFCGRVFVSQCRSSKGMQRGHCWCVDELGVPLPSRAGDDGTLPCDGE